MLQRAASVGGDFLRRLLSGGLAIVNLLSLLALTPVVAFYLLVLDREWRRRRWLELIEAGLDPSRPGRRPKLGFPW